MADPDLVMSNFEWPYLRNESAHKLLISTRVAFLRSADQMALISSSIKFKTVADCIF